MTERSRDRILVVDDEDLVRAMIRTALESEGYEVFEARDGEGATRQVVHLVPDLVLTDLLMPGMNGDEFCRLFRQSDAGRDIPVILMTGLQESGIRERALASGADEFLVKPFSSMELVARVRSVLRTRHLAAQVAETRSTPARPSPSTALLLREPGRVLVVEDELAALDTIRGLLKEIGAVVSATGTLAGARALLAQGSFDVILLDLMLPDGSGLDLLREIKADARTHLYSVVVLTALGGSQDRVHGLDLGADDYLVKPSTAIELQARVRKQVAIKRFRDTLLARATEAEALVHEDALTALLNRRYLDETLPRLLQSCHRYHQELSVLMVDIDHFKRINDNFGHAAGDDVLRRVAQILKTSLRGSDWAARYGGEEFAIVLPITDLPTAIRVGERVRRTVEETSLVIHGREGGLRVTVSIGVATCVKEKLSAQEMIDRADAALYLAKQTGRNRTCPHGGGSLSAPRPSRT